MPPFGLILLLLQPPAAPPMHPPIYTHTEVNGAEHPELIPDEMVWRSLLDQIAGDLLDGVDLPIPTSIYHIATPDERALLRREALALKAWKAGADQRAQTIKARVTPADWRLIHAGQPPAHWADVNAELQALTAELKEHILATRDRLLATLSVDVQQAIEQDIERRRRGISFTSVSAIFGQPPSPKP